MPDPSFRPAGPAAGSSGPVPIASSPDPAVSQPALLPRLKGWLDTLLVADVFLVIAAALWFGVAVLLQSQGIARPLTLFQLLWEPLFTPAIGLLMAAALVSGLLGWWQRRGRR